MQRGLIQIYTGAGKGKTTAALGLTLRALGAGLKVYLAQFIKKGEFSEIKALRRFQPNVMIHQSGRGHFIKGRPSAADRASAANGLAALSKAMLSGKYDLVIADEIFCALNCNLISRPAVNGLLKKKPAGVELVLTGRHAPRQLIKKAGLVTEMRKIKHPFDRGLRARPGIEY